jgi:hypothetical protein
MDCPQCEAEVPSDNAFCGKCGYAMRDHGPERTDQSRIRVHEEPAPTDDEDRHSRPSSPRIRKHTVLGMPPATRRRSEPPVASQPPPPPPASIASARSARRTPQKTMMGIPRPELPDPRSSEPEASPASPSGAALGNPPSPPPLPGQERPSHRSRARVRYDNSFEPPPVTMRRRRAFGGVGVLVALAAVWLIYRFLNG